MNICLVGNNLTSLILSKTLINSGAILDIFYFKNKKNSPSIRTIGISKSNIDFINNNICQLKLKNFNKISKIQIFSEMKVLRKSYLLRKFKHFLIKNATPPPRFKKFEK